MSAYTLSVGLALLCALLSSGLILSLIGGLAVATELNTERAKNLTTYETWRDCQDELNTLQESLVAQGLAIREVHQGKTTLHLILPKRPSRVTHYRLQKKGPASPEEQT